MSDVVRWTENDKTNNNENHNNIRVSDEYNTSHSTKQDSEYSSCCRSFSKSVNNAIIDKNQTSRVINNISNSNKTSRSDSSSLDSCSVAALRVEHSWNSECILRHTKTIKTTKTKLSVKNYLVTKIMSNVKANENGGVRKRNDRSFYKSISLSYLFVILQINILLSNFIVMVCASDQLYTTGNYTNSRTSNLFGDSIGHTSNDHGHYTSSWAVHIPNGDNDNLADRVAAEHGFINMGKIFNDHYHFHHNKIAKRSLQPSHHHQKRLSNDERILWSRQQRAKSRQKRDFIRMRPTRTSQTLSFAGAIKLNDQKWPQMWYLNRGNDIDMNVIPVWKEGITGKGVVVTILDDGLESDHPDLEANYDALASYDVNSHDPNPMPRYDMQDTNRHGTRCAGEVAATANNSLCTVGIAYGAKVGGVRMLDGDVTDAVEARSLSLNPQHIDIYSASWGPDDDGKTVDGPGELATQAFIDGVTTGRGGKGSIFIWASGNGGRETDNCNCDGYTNSIWTLSISSATEGGHVPWYSEKCSSTLATTYSSGGLDEKQVITTDLHHACTSSHTGTSASAPLAAGIVALVLEANRNLTWRDLQHIVVRTAKPGNLKDPSWTRNGVGRRVSHSFGYGLMDASAMVKTAKTWKTVPEQQRCEINAPHSDKVIPPKNHITLQLNVQHCMGVNFLEHVQAKITLTSQRRGDIQIYLKSPAGTKVTLLTSRNHDISRSGFNQWPFMSVHTWGEAPHGNWQLEIHNEGRYLAQISQWDMIFYGTSQPTQPDDPVRANPGKYGSYGGEMEHNILDIDSDAASGQWRNLQQVGEAHVDVQRTTSNDLTSKACLSYSTDQKCLECEQTTFLYNGGCYNRCPDEAYMVPEYPTIPPASRYRTNSRSESLSLRRRRDEESEMGTYENLNDIIQKQRAIMHPIPQKLCASCHPTCLKCRGPNQSHCLSCGSGFNLRVVNSDESYCYPTLQGRPLKANLSREAGSLSDDVNFSLGFVKNLNMAYSIVALFVMILVVALIINAYKKQLKSCLLGGNGHDYDRVQFDCESDERKVLKFMEYTSVDDDFKNDNKYDPHEPPAKIFGVRENIK